MADAVSFLYMVCLDLGCVNSDTVSRGSQVGRGGAELMPFDRRVVGSNPAFSRHAGTLGKSFTYSCL